MIRVLNANITLDVQLQIYLERTDLWSDRVTVDDLQTFQVDEEILLKHTYVILKGLEDKRIIKQKPKTHIQTAQEQRQQVTTWFSATAKSTVNPKIIQDKKQDKSKLRID